MALVLKLNRGASYTTINLNDVTNYKVLDTWSPRVATYKVSQFGGLVFNEVVESIPLYIKGTTAAQVYEKLEDIIAALGQARSWRLGATVDPVLLEFLPNGTSLGAVVQAAVLGTPLDASDLYQTAQYGLYMAGNSYETLIDLPLLRRGLWLGAAETPSASSAVANPGAMSVTFSTSVRIPSPVKLTISTADTPIAEGNQGYVFVSDQADKIFVVSTSLMTPISGTWDTVAETSAEGDSYRKTTSFTGDQTLGTPSLTGDVNEDARTWSVYASLRNLSTDYPWTIRARVTGGSYAYTRRLTLVNDLNKYPKIEHLGFASIQGTLTDVTLYATPASGMAAGDELEIDYIILVAVDEFTRAIPFDSTLPNPTNPITLDDVIIDDRSLTYPQPAMTINGQYPTVLSDLLVYSVGTNLTARIVGTYPVSGSEQFVILRFLGGGAEVEYSLTATRRQGYLVVR